jgi:hypothetical protein
MPCLGNFATLALFAVFLSFRLRLSHAAEERD